MDSGNLGDYKANGLEKRVAAGVFMERSART